MGRVIVVGSVNVDLVVTSDHLPAPGETVIGGRFSQHHGGKGGNQAVAAARLGADVRFVGAVGDDPFGAQARAALIAEGIDLAELRTLPGEATGVALILVDGRGENSISVASGANAAVTPAQVEAAFTAIGPGPGDVVLVGHEVPTASAQAALTLGRAAGSTTILNPAPATGLTTATLAEADIVTPNDGELAVLAGSLGGTVGSSDGAAGTDTAAALLAAGAGRAYLVSLGAAGARLTRPAGTIAIPALHVEAVDTVGAGDTLNGALAGGLAAGLDLETAARRAVAAASLAVTRAGAREGMPTAAELEAVLG
jgi:ribokinase